MIDYAKIMIKNKKHYPYDVVVWNQKLKNIQPQIDKQEREARNKKESKDEVVEK